MNDSLRIAQLELEIKDVYPLKINCELNEHYMPSLYKTKDIAHAEFYHRVTNSMAMTVKHKDDDGWEEKLLQVFFEVGARWVDDLEAEEDDKFVYATATATFIAEYNYENELDVECIKEFSLKNASYHMWPYWRELLSSISTRFQLPKAVLPMRQPAENHDNDIASVERKEGL